MIPVDLLNYQLIRLLGKGGMGEVYLARNKNIEQYVAVKALHPQYANNPMLRARFKQEAVMLNSLNHPNIVKFINFVENEYGVFLIMEYVEGYTLEDYVTKRNGLIVEQKAYPMMAEILDAFSYAHSKGIIHRDIKPSNIFLDNEGHIKIMDFGIAQIIAESSLTPGMPNGGGNVMGTPAYMSPEQVYGLMLDQRSDIYSLGVLFHQMLTGRAPYDSTTMSELEIKSHVVNDTLPRMKNYYPYISDGLQVMVDKATSKKPEDRYNNCDDMLAAVKKVLAPEKRSKMPLYIGVAAAVVCLIAGLGVWDYFRTKVDYYKDYVEVYGVAKGVGSLSSREASHRELTYRVESSRWKVRRVTLVNGKGKTVKHTDTEHMSTRYSDTYYFYNGDGQLDYKKVYDPYGKLLYKIDYDENLKTAMFKYDDEHGTAKRLQANTTQMYGAYSNSRERSCITRQMLTWDDEGHLLRMEYASGEDNTKIGDSDNIYGMEYEYDEKGRVKELHFLGQDNKIRGNKIGLAIKQYEYDEDDNWTKVVYLNAEKQASHDGNNCTVVNISYDEWGNRASETYTTLTGKPANRTDMGAFGFAYTYDDDGNRLTQTSIDGYGKPMINKYGFATIQNEFNEDGFLVRESYLDEKGNKATNCNDSEAYGMLQYTRDEKGLMLSYEAFDQNGKAIEMSNGVHKMTVEYDSIGNALKQAYFDNSGRATKNSGFESSCIFTYDEYSRHTSTRYFDENGNPTFDNSGISVCRFTYDNTGNITKYEYFGKDGKTYVTSKDGFAVEEVTYNEVGSTKTIHHYDSSMNPCMSTYGYYALDYEYDSKTNFMTAIRYYNVNKAITSIKKYTYDSNGNNTAEWTVNASGALIGSVTHYEYDKCNNITRKYYTNLSGSKVKCAEAPYAEVRMKYDERGNVTEQQFLDASGRPSCDEQKTYKRIKKYDDRNNYVYEKNLGADGKPLHGANVNPEAKVTYDNWGNMTSITCYDGYGNPDNCAYGFHKLEYTYDSRNLRISEAYKNKAGKLVKHSNLGYAKANYTYDDKRNRTEEKYFDTSGSVTYRVTYTFNAQNSMTEAKILNAAGKLDDSKIGFSRLVISYESNGITPTKKKYYRAGSMIAYQNYNAKTGKWGDLQFAY